MRLTIDTSELDRLRDKLNAFSDRRFAAGLATALTRTAAEVLKAERAEMLDVFDRPTPYTLGALKMTAATAQSLRAEVLVRTDASGGRPPVSWLRWQISGGLRTQTGIERQLVAGKAMRNDQRMVPGKFARLDAFGNVSRGQLAQILSQLRIETGRLGSSRTLPRLAFEDSKQDRQRKRGVIRRAYQKAGQFVAFPNGRGKLLPGIYQVQQFAAGRASPRPVLIFVSKASYEAERFDFDYVGQITARRVLGLEVDRAMRESLARLDARTAAGGGA